MLRLLLDRVVVVIVVVVVELVSGSDVEVEKGFRGLKIDEVEVDSSCRGTTFLARTTCVKMIQNPIFSGLTGTMLTSIHRRDSG